MARQTALITGATSGIGAAFARRLAAEGWDLIVTGRREKELGAVVAELVATHGVNVSRVTADFSHDEGIQKIEALVRGHDGLGMLVNNAGFNTTVPFEDDSVEAATDMIRCHVDAVARLTHAALPRMLVRGKGDIINVSSICGYLPSPNNPIYAATKAFVTNFTEGLAGQVGPRGLRMQALCPGYTRSEIHTRMGLDPDSLVKGGPMRFMSAEAVVSASLAALARGQVVCVPGLRNRIVLGLLRVLQYVPRPLYYMLQRGVRAVRGRR